MYSFQKWLILFSLFAAWSGPVKAEPVITLATSIPVSGPVEELLLLQAPGGLVYTLAVVQGELRIFQTDATGNADRYVPEGFPSALGEIRSLEVAALGLTQYAVCIGRLDGLDAVHVLGLDVEGVLRYFPVPETRTPGSLSRYGLSVSWNGSLNLYVLLDGALQGIFGIGASGSRESRTLYTPAAHTGAAPGAAAGIGGFEVFSDLSHTYDALWIRLDQEAQHDYTLLLIGEGQTLAQESLGILPTGSILRSGMTFEGDVLFTVIQGKEVRLIQAQEGRFITIKTFSAPLAVRRYSAAVGFGEPIGVAVCGDPEAQAVYGVTGRGSIPRFIPWVSGEQESLTLGAMIYADPGHVSVIYKRDEIWRIALADTQGNLLSDQIPEDLEPGAEFFFAQQSLKPRLFFRAGTEKLVPYTFDGTSTPPSWRREGDTPIPVELQKKRIRYDADPQDNPGSRGTEFISLGIERGLCLFHPGSGVYQELRGGRFSASLTINGLTFLAAAAANELGLYRIEE